MKICPECAVEISEEASRCPSCGAIFDAKKTRLHVYGTNSDDVQRVAAQLTEPIQTKKEPDKASLILHGIKNNPLLSLIIVFGLIIISLGSFTDAIGKIIGFYNSTIKPIFLSESSSAGPELSLFVNPMSPLSVGLSLSNPSLHEVEISLIEFSPLHVVDTCLGCAYHARIPLTINLSKLPGFNSVDVITGESPNQPAREILFGRDGTYKLKPGNSAPLVLSVPGKSDRGVVFVIDVTINDITLSKQRTFTPPFVFYYVGPPNFEPTLQVLGFKEWSSSVDDYLRENVAYALRQFGDPRVVSDLVVAATEDTKQSVRIAAIGSLAFFKSDIAFETILSALSFGDQSGGFTAEQAAGIRRAAAEALGRYGEQSVADSLLSSWLNDDGFWVANEAIEAYGRLSPPGVIATLDQILSEYEGGSHEDYHSLASIVTAYANTKNTGAKKVLLRFAKTKGHGMHFERRAALHGLRYHPDDETIKLLVQVALEDEDEGDAAVSSLVYIDAEDALAELRSTGDDRIRQHIDFWERFGRQ